jgi:glycosyltransferase domain-containing protein
MTRNNSNLLQDSKFTILLTQFGRQKFSDRFLGYLSKISATYPIVYADGDADGEGRLIYEKYQAQLNIKHLEHRQNIKFKDYFTMMVKALSEVKTKYVMLCDNDDFIIENGIHDLILFLEDNEDYVSAGSPTVNMQINNFSFDNFGDQIYFDSVYEHYRTEEPLLNWEHQVKESFLNFQPNFYYIFRTEVLLDIWKEILNINFTDLTIMEFFFQLKTLTHGKQYTFKNNLHYVRQTGTGTFAQGYDFSDNLVRNSLPSDIRSLASNISSHCNSDHHSSEEIYESILTNYALSLNFYLPHNVLRYRFQRLFKIKVFILKVLNKFIFLKKINYLYRERKLIQKLKRFYGKSRYRMISAELNTIKLFLNSK